MRKTSHLERISALLKQGLVGDPGVSVERPQPESFGSPDCFSRAWAAYHFDRKVEAAGDVKRLHQEAIEAFLKREEFIRKKQQPWRSWWSEQLGLNLEFPHFEEVRREIAKILGPASIDEILRGSGWGPGATSSLKGRDARLDKKILEESWSVTTRCLPYAQAYMSTAYPWLRSRGIHAEGPVCLMPTEFSVTECSRFATVPKDRSKRRPIDIQPTLNLFFQKGLGAAIRRRLKRYGIDLDDQTSNQRAAKAAFTQSLSTIDLESASDSIPYELVRLLLPADWFYHLDNLRTRFTKIDRSIHVLQKFSSMGNGFTFELESLIFFALCRVTARGEPVWVFGDDIVVPRSASADLVRRLSDFGFSVNLDKSFIDGPFFESCGKHFYMGVDVTPPLQRKEVCDFPSAVSTANRIFRFGERLSGFPGVLDPRVKFAWEAAFAIAIRFWRISAPRLRHVLPVQGYDVDGDASLIIPEPQVWTSVGLADLYGVKISSRLIDASGPALYADALRSPRFVNPDRRGNSQKISLRGQTKVRLGRHRRWRSTITPFPS